MLLARNKTLSSCVRSIQVVGCARRSLLIPPSGKLAVPVGKLRSTVLTSVFKPRPSGQDAVVKSQKDLAPRRMIDSYREASLALRTDKTVQDSMTLRDLYVNNFNKVRLGKILEDLDTMAGWIAYTHNMTEGQTSSPLVIVTACVDRIDLQSDVLSIDADIMLRGHVTWAGDSSMEITVEVEQECDGQLKKMMEAQFLMVARDCNGKRKAFVHPLICETEAEKAVFLDGQAAKKRREKVAGASLLKTAPDDKETLLIHKLFLDTLDSKEVTFRHRTLPANSVWMSDTMLKNVIVCFPQERNLANKMFGGYLMRQAFELAWANACLFCKARPLALAMDDIVFLQPVEIGSLLFVSSQIVYTEGKYFQVRVHAEVVNPQDGSHATTNTFHFTFVNTSPHTVTSVMPNSYSEYMLYVDGKRHFEVKAKRIASSTR